MFIRLIYIIVFYLTYVFCKWITRQKTDKDMAKISKAHINTPKNTHSPAHNKTKNTKAPHFFSRVTQSLCSDSVPVGTKFSPGKERKTGMRRSLSSCSEQSFPSHIPFSLFVDSVSDLDAKGKKEVDLTPKRAP